MKSVVRVAAAATFTSAFLLFLLLGAFIPYAAAATTSITISPNSGTVGTKIDVSGQGYAPNTKFDPELGQRQRELDFGWQSYRNDRHQGDADTMATCQSANKCLGIHSQ